MAVDPNQPWLTIATVVKDDAVGLVRTRDSILAQDTLGVEWVVVDGSAEREHVEAVVVGQEHVASRLTWSAPTGVYPAMNEALRLARGSYIHFLNAGDAYADASVLAGLRRTTLENDPIWLYGQVGFVSTSGREVVPPPFDYAAEKAVSFSRGRFPPHQGTVTLTAALISAGGFDPSYRIVADYAAFLRLSKVADPVHIDAQVARFYEGGISSTRWRESISEFHRARVAILRPTGRAAWRERFETVSQLTRMGAGRMANSWRWDGAR